MVIIVQNQPSKAMINSVFLLTSPIQFLIVKITSIPTTPAIQ